MSMHNELISNRIHDLSSNKEISINRIATLGGVTTSTVQAIFDGNSKNPTIRTIKAVCDGLDISVSEFFNFPPYNQRPTESDQSMEKMLNEVNHLQAQLADLQEKLSKKIEN